MRLIPMTVEYQDGMVRREHFSTEGFARLWAKGKHWQKPEQPVKRIRIGERIIFQ